MKKQSIVLLIAIALGLLAACQPGGMLATVTPAPPVETLTPVCEWPCTADEKLTAQALLATANMAMTLTAQAGSETPTPSCEIWPCPNDSLTLTADASLTVRPSVGDLGWGSVYGLITDAVTGLPVANAQISCIHNSYTVPENGRCLGVTWTNADGIYSFTTVNFHDTDVITLIVDAPGYQHLEFRQSLFTLAGFKADLKLEPATDELSPSPTFIIMCTAPACEQGVLACGDPNGCPGGCGTICATFTPGP